MQRGLPRIRCCKSSRGSKSPSVCLPGHEEPIHHSPQLSHILLQRAGQQFLLPTVYQVISSRPLRQSTQAVISQPVSQCVSVCSLQWVRGSATIGMFLCVPPSPPGSIWEWGEQWGKHWAQRLHHQHSGALCTL